MTTTAVAKTKGVGALLVAAEDRIADVLPKYMTAERQVRLARLIIAQNASLLKCDPASVVIAVMDASRLGLEIGRDAHLVPYKTTCKMIPDWKGLVGLVWRTAQIIIDTGVVYEDERPQFVFQKGLAPVLQHQPILNVKHTPDEVHAVYAVAEFPDGRRLFDVMGKDEVDKIRKRSKAKDAGPWITDTIAMSKKTVVKRLMKLLPQSSEITAAIEYDNRYEVGGMTRPLPHESVEAVTSAVSEQLTEKLDHLLSESAPESKATEDQSA